MGASNPWIDNRTDEICRLSLEQQESVVRGAAPEFIARLYPKLASISNEDFVNYHATETFAVFHKLAMQLAEQENGTRTAEAELMAALIAMSYITPTNQISNAAQAARTTVSPNARGKQ